ncbi:sce7726 family protein [Pantoea agglomerans]|uniref:sce7726 family protein n=1 Tax=Enterobacter agglomerans TaxID=549 RepID=UPI0021666DE1|nr:sce7726 family protein [Pantoea agglomerans]UVV72788.1 sce7726 family protein [Pantoea agglomerans]
MNPTQLSALSRMFSPSVISEIAKKGQSPLFSRLLSETSVFEIDDPADVTIGDAFDRAFSLLRRSGLRNEYVYRSALIRNVLLGRHSLRTASMLTEFRISSSKADMVILNGYGTVYEIKSDRDSLARLESQIENYRKAFSKIYVVAGTGHIQDVLDKTSEDVGVMNLIRWNRISIVREAKENFDYICPATIFDSLRLGEAIDILKDLNVDIPDLPNTLMRNTLRSIFIELDPIDVQYCMIKTLKRTRNLAPLSTLIANLPYALQSIALMVQLRNKDHDRLVETLNKPLNEAFKWV